MKKISILSLAVLLSATSFEAKTITFENDEAQAVALEHNQDAAHREVLEAVGVGQSTGVLISPYHYLSSDNAHPADEDGYIHFKNADGEILESAKVAGYFIQQNLEEVGKGSGQPYRVPTHNWQLCVLSKPIKSIRPVHLSSLKAEQLSALGNDTKISTIATDVEGHKVVLTYDKLAFEDKYIKATPADKFTFEHQDAGMPLFVEEAGEMKLVGLWSSSFKRPSLQEAQHNFTYLLDIHDFLKEQFQRMEPLALTLAPAATQDKPHRIKGVWHRRPLAINLDDLEEGEHLYQATPSGKRREEVILVDHRLKGRAAKIDNEGDKVRITLKQQNVTVRMESASNYYQSSAQHINVHSYVFPYGDITITFTFENGSKKCVTYHHNEN